VARPIFVLYPSWNIHIMIEFGRKPRRRIKLSETTLAVVELTGINYVRRDRDSIESTYLLP
jgi:hypothetical protein